MNVDFRLLGQPQDFVGNALAGFQAGQRQGAIRRAGNALAMGNEAAGINALFQGGMIEPATALQDRAMDRQRIQTQDARMAKQDERQDAVFARQQQDWTHEDKQRLTQELLREAMALRTAPDAERPAMYQSRAVPLLQKIGVPQPEIDRVLADGHLTNEELDAFIVQMGGEPRKLQVVQGRDGSIATVDPFSAADPRSGFTVLQEPIADPMEDLKRQLMEAQIAAQQALVGQRERSNRPRPSGGGGGGGAGLPAGFVLD